LFSLDLLLKLTSARDNQEQPEAARSSHEQPGAARSSQEQARKSQGQPGKLKMSTAHAPEHCNAPRGYKVAIRCRRGAHL
jgi:hypothetical protein